MVIYKEIKNLNILFFFLLLSCSKTEKPRIDSNKVIIHAKIVSYANLIKQPENNSYCHTNSWRNGYEFDKKNAYYVSAKINNKLLAELCESDSFPINAILNENKYALYGKYINRWEFINSTGGLICETEKFDGQKLIEVHRIGEIDEVIIGPLIEQPDKMIIKILNSKNYRNNLFPEFVINKNK